MIYDTYLEIKIKKEVICRERVPFKCTCSSSVKMEFVRVLDACANSFLPLNLRNKTIGAGFK